MMCWNCSMGPLLPQDLAQQAEAIESFADQEAWLKKYADSPVATLRLSERTLRRARKR